MYTHMYTGMVGETYYRKTGTVGEVGLPLFAPPHALTLGPAHWDPAHAASKRKAGSLNNKHKSSRRNTLHEICIVYPFYPRINVVCEVSDQRDDELTS